ncbi:hypothetical protein U1Q18_035478 [Sarracenia purpurea var. burkii]
MVMQRVTLSQKVNFNSEHPQLDGSGVDLLLDAHAHDCARVSAAMPQFRLVYHPMETPPQVPSPSAWPQHCTIFLATEPKAQVEEHVQELFQSVPNLSVLNYQAYCL